MVEEAIKIIDIRHPDYSAESDNWVKWRKTYEGGTTFIDEYLVKFSTRESATDFTDRTAMTYCPAFAKEALNDIKNSIFQRTSDITRKGGPESYTSSVLGENGGIDLKGSSMNAFIGREVLPELLTMSKVGVFVDMPIITDSENKVATKADSNGKRPYMYMYKAEDILSWNTTMTETGIEFTSVLLRDHIHNIEEEFSLPTEEWIRYRHMYVEGEQVVVAFYNEDNEQIDIDGVVGATTYPLEISVIPLTIFEISDSLLRDVADYQISLLNVASSDMSYTLKCNFPFYTEQFDSRLNSEFLRPGGNENEDNTEENSKAAKDHTISVGVASGRRYPKDLDRPGFIHPSAEPLEASMKKQKQLKEEIRQLMSLALSDINPKMASAESKTMDMQGLEAGLSYIGLELENGERRIATFWAMYEGTEQVSTIKYPEKYSLTTDVERRKEAKEIRDSSKGVPSVLYQKQINKQIVRITIGHKVSVEELAKIEAEIDSNAIACIDPDVIAKDIENGLLSIETASKAKGYPDGEPEAAKKEHAERAARIAAAQAKEMGARGVSDLDSEKDSADKEKKDSLNKDKDNEIKEKQRGQGKKIGDNS